MSREEKDVSESGIWQIPPGKASVSTWRLSEGLSCGNKLWWYLGKSIPGRMHSTCKGPEARVSGCVRGSHQAGMAGVLVWSVSHCTDIYWAPAGAKPCSGHWGDNGHQLRPGAALRDLMFLRRDKSKTTNGRDWLSEPLALWVSSAAPLSLALAAVKWLPISLGAGAWVLVMACSVILGSARPAHRAVYFSRAHSLLRALVLCVPTAGHALPPRHLLGQLLFFSVVPTSTLYLKICPLGCPVMPDLCLFFFTKQLYTF